MPDSASVSLTVKGRAWLYQPLESVARPAVSVTVGAVLSSLTVRAVALVVKPALLVQVPLKVVPAVSAVCDWSAVHVTGLLMLSVPVVLTVTLLMYQPFVPAVPAVTARAAEGAVLSSLMVSGGALVVTPPLTQEPLKVVPVVSVVWT